MRDQAALRAQGHRMAAAFPCLRARKHEQVDGGIAHARAQLALNAQADAAQVQATPVQPQPMQHALADQDANLWLYSYEKGTRHAFDAIYHALREIAGIQHEDDFVARAQHIAAQQLGFELPTVVLERAWVDVLDVRALYAYCVFRSFLQVSNQQIRLESQDVNSARGARDFFATCNLHEVDVSPASDGRLKGLERFILRLPRQSIRNTKAYPAALFDLESDIKRWQRIQLREMERSGSSLSSRYLKVAVYNRSSLRPAESGCGQFRGNELAGVEAVLKRLNALRAALRAKFPGQDLNILLLGVDTDTDALRIHLPDANGELSPYRYLDMLDAYRATLGMSAEDAYQALQQRVDQVSRIQGWGRGEGELESGMRRFITQLMISNISQIDYVQRFHHGHYADFSHAERFMLIGENVESFQLRNFAYYAHLFTFEEGAEDVEQGMQVLHATHFPRGLPIPVVVHYRYDALVDGSRERAVARCKRVSQALLHRYAQLASTGMLQCFMTVREKSADAPLEWLYQDLAVTDSSWVMQ